ncbi:MAG: 3-oxoacyl-[acyl-carrier-protein] reductase [Bacillota bacterium]|nr:3-oxoacyl-[acyl-carrier-protein] reductase [Bacillota bacterium]
MNPLHSIMPLFGRVALVTGGSRGIGRAVACRLAEQGAHVALLYSGNEAAAQETMEQLSAIRERLAGLCPHRGEADFDASLPKYAAYRCNVASFDEVSAVIDRIASEIGRVDILVNNAGITRDNLILKMEVSDFDAVLDVNLKGAFHLVKACMRHLMKSACGRVINIASVIGLTGNTGQANYAAAKAGVIGMTKSIARELAGKKVTCNAIAPGFIETDMTAALDETSRNNILSGIPLKRSGKAEEIAAAVAFLASDAAAYITGEVLRIDGGMCM